MFSGFVSTYWLIGLVIPGRLDQIYKIFTEYLTKVKTIKMYVDGQLSSTIKTMLDNEIYNMNNIL